MSLAKELLKHIPAEELLPLVFDEVLTLIKNPNSSNAKKLERILVPFGTSLASKYPGKICPNFSQTKEGDFPG